MKTKEDVAREFFSRLYCGDHHLPSKVRDFGYGWEVTDHHDMSTWDTDRLTRAVFLAHDMGLRLSIMPCMRYLRLAVWQRDRSGTIMDGHPTLEQATAKWRERNPFPGDPT